MTVVAGTDKADTPILGLDAASAQSLPTRAGPSDHSLSEWYCFGTVTVTYAVMENVAIYQVTNLGVETLIVPPSSTPSRGTFTATVGFTYYATGPSNLTPEDNHHLLAPLSLAGTQFGHYVVDRGAPQSYTVYVYSPYGPATVNFYNNAFIGGTITSTVNLTKGGSTFFTGTNTSVWTFISSTAPVICTLANTSAAALWDKTIISPAAPLVYNRFQNSAITVTGGIANTTNNYATYSNLIENVAASTSADGSGGDTASALGLNNLSNNYCFGNTLSDYVIAAPYDNTYVSVYYWSGTAWVLLEGHSLTGGTTLVPVGIARDGTLGPGVEGLTTNGLANNFANGATLWKWVGNNPFYLGINDSQDDELSMLGWNTSRTTVARRSTDVNWLDLWGGYHGVLNGGALYSHTSNSVVLDGVDDWVEIANTNYPSTWSNPFSLEIWIFIPTAANWGSATVRNNIICRGSYGGVHGICRTATNNQVSSFLRDNTGTFTFAESFGTITRNTWQQLVCTWNGTTNSLYVNGVLAGTSTWNLAPTNIPTSTTWKVGSNTAFGGTEGSFMNGSVGSMKIYNRALTAQEVLQNFSALRGRFGL